MREMQSPEGGYYSTLDADSEGGEGKFYVWDPGQIKTLLSDDEYRVFARRFGLNQPANFEGHWHLHVVADFTGIAHELSVPENRVVKLMDSARGKLLKVRAQRIWPDRDEKILTSWNALMIRGMAVAARQLQRDDLIDSAYRSFEFIRNSMWKKSRLLATYKDGKAHLNAYLDDYAFLLDATLELLQARWRQGVLDFAIGIAEVMLEHFADPEHGGFYFTANDHERLIYRPKPFGDDALPAGNGIAARALSRLGHVTAEPRYLNAADHALRAAWSSILELPYAHSSLLTALEESLYPPQMIILRGRNKATLSDWKAHCDSGYVPRRMTFAIPTDGGDDLPAMFAAHTVNEDIVAYVCMDTSCSTPVTDLQQLDKLLEIKS
jgi:hypothetical protein